MSETSWLTELERLKRAAAGARPFVTAAFAVSRDGCLTRTRGSATVISGPESQQLTHELRARHDALLVGVETVLSDDPALTTRLVEGPSPLRVVLDSQLRVPVTAKLLRSTARPAWLVTREPADEKKARALTAAGAEVVQVPAADGGISIPALLDLLALSGVRSLMLEGGSAVLESFFRANAVDYVALTVSRRRLSNPCAVRLGDCTSAVLEAWRGRTQGIHVGDDLLAAGPLAAAEPEPTWTDHRLAAP